METIATITRNDLMSFFRNEGSLDKLSVDDRIEIFSTILLGRADFKIELFTEIFSDYGITHLNITENLDG
jgi:hypothetical protein